MVSTTIPSSCNSASDKRNIFSENRNADNSSDVVTKNFGKIPWTYEELLQAHALPPEHYESLVVRLCLLADGVETTASKSPSNDPTDSMASLEETIYNLLVPRINAIVEKQRRLSEIRTKVGRKGGRPRKQNTTKPPEKPLGTPDKKPIGFSESTPEKQNKPIGFCDSVNDCNSTSNDANKNDVKTVSPPHAYTLCIYNEEEKSSSPYTGFIEDSNTNNKEGVLNLGDRAKNGIDPVWGFNGDVKIKWGFDVPMERTWVAWSDPTLHDILSVFPVPPDRGRWLAISMAIYDFCVTHHVPNAHDEWETWCRGGQRFNKEENDEQWASFVHKTFRDDAGRKITWRTLLKAWWGGLSIVRPVLDAGEASHGDNAETRRRKTGKRASAKRERKDPFVPVSGHMVCAGKTITEMADVIYGTVEDVAARAAIPSDEELDKMMVAFMAKRGFPEWFVRSMGCRGVWHEATGRPAVEIPYIGEKDWYVAYRFMDIAPNEKDGRERYRMSSGPARNYCQNFLIREEMNTIFLVEGQFDAASIVLTGCPAIAVKSISNIVAHEKAKPVAGRRFIILRDGDAAGENYAEAWRKKLEENGLTVSVEVLPDDVKDANEYLMRYGKDALADRLKEFMDKVENMTTVQIVNNSANSEMPKVAMA